MEYAINTFVVCRGEFTPLAALVTPPVDLDEQADDECADCLYIDGAIVWRIGDEILLSQLNWHSIDQLWGYIVNGLLELLDRDTFETYFPGQPLLLGFQKLDDANVEVAVASNRFIVGHEVFFRSLTEGAYAFFSRMKLWFPQRQSLWAQDLNNILWVRETLGLDGLPRDAE